MKMKEDQTTTDKVPKDFYIGMKKKKRKKVNQTLEESKLDDSFYGYGELKNEQSGINKAEEPEEEFITEELFQKALQAALDQGIIN